MYFSLNTGEQRKTQKTDLSALRPTAPQPNVKSGLRFGTAGVPNPRKQLEDPMWGRREELPSSAENVQCLAPKWCVSGSPGAISIARNVLACTA